MPFGRPDIRRALTGQESCKKGMKRNMKRANIKCPYCGARAYLRPASVVYGGHTDDAGAKLYVCARYPVCDAYVAAHKDTLLPMGTLADRNLRRKRIEAHSALNRLIAAGFMTRKQAYRWLQIQLGLPESEAHIAKFSELRCQKVIDLCSAFTRAQARVA